jgi:Ca2+-binding RTX toxin-like protein
MRIGDDDLGTNLSENFLSTIEVSRVAATVPAPFAKVVFRNPRYWLVVVAGDDDDETTDEITVGPFESSFRANTAIGGGGSGDRIDAGNSLTSVLLVGGPGEDTLTGGSSNDILLVRTLWATS